jgi:hypothetical protein
MIRSTSAKTIKKVKIVINIENKIKTNINTTKEKKKKHQRGNELTRAQ